MQRFLVRCAVLLFAAGACCASTSCTEPVQRSNVAVFIDADSNVRRRVLDVEVQLEAEDAQGTGYKTRDNRHFELEDRRWPLQFRLPVADGDVGGRYQLTASGRNAENAVVVQARVIRRVMAGQNVELRVHFEAPCFNRVPLCGQKLTCSDGNCVPADGDAYDRFDRGGDAGTAPPADDDGPMIVDRSTGGVVADADACDTNGARACAGHASRTPLLCQDGVWQPQPECGENERCDTAMGAQRGMCRPIAQECLNQQPDVPFCDADEAMMVCTDLVSSEVRACQDNERCVPEGKSVRCACKPGFVYNGTSCVEATSCAQDRGGCDPLTECLPMSGGKRRCGPCPAGFTGDGTIGCSPLLTSLSTSAGELEPAFSSEIFDYKLKVPMLVQRVAFTATAPANARVMLNGSDIRSGTPALSQVLKRGSNMAEVVVSSERGVPTAYRVTIERSLSQEAYLKSSEPGEYDHLGYDLVATDNAVLATAWWEDSDASGVNGDASDNSLTHAGAAYLFESRGGRWTQTAYFKPSDPSSHAAFGTSIAISGDTVAIGAQEADDDPRTADGDRPGSVYIFKRNGGTWSQTAKLTPEDAQPDSRFGTAVAIEGDTLAVGAVFASTNVSESGAVYMFQRSGDSWKQTAKLAASMPSRGAYFGSEIKLEGNTLVVAAQEEGLAASRSGAVYVFERDGEGWKQVQRLLPAKISDDATFGFSLALRGNTLIIGAPRGEWATTQRKPSGEVYVFERGVMRWAQTAVLKAARPAISDYFGWSIALTDTALLVGTMGDGWGGRGFDAVPGVGSAGFSGGAYLFARDGQAWVQSAYFKSSNADDNDGFGYSVALSEDAAFVASVYESSKTKGVNGDMTDNSFMNAGAVYVFR